MASFNKAGIGNQRRCATLDPNMNHESDNMLRIEFEQEDNGRWIAEIVELPGVMVYGATRQEAKEKVKALALRTLADRLEHGETVPELGELFVTA